MGNILKDAGKSIAKALGVAEQKPCASAQERQAAHQACLQAHHAKRDEALERARIARGSAMADYERKAAEFGRESSAALLSERERIADLFGTREEKNAMQTEASERINGAVERKRKAAEVERDKRLAEIEAEAEPAARECTRCVEAAEKVFAEGEREVRAKLLEDFYAAVTPAIQAWIDAPNKAKAEPIARSFWDHNVRCKRELGAELTTEAICFAFANVVGAEKPGIANQLGGDPNYVSAHMRAAQEFVKSLESGAVEMNKALHLLNDAIDDLVAKAPEPDERMVRRYAVKKGCATVGEVMLACQAFDREEEQKRRAEAVANYRATKLVSNKDGYSVIEYTDGGIEEVHHDGGKGRRVVVKRAGGLPPETTASA